MQVDALQVRRIVRWLMDEPGCDVPSAEDTEIAEMLGMVRVRSRYGYGGIGFVDKLLVPSEKREEGKG